MAIRWYLGIATIPAVAAVMLLATAAEGDQVYLKETTEKELGPAQLCMANWAETVWPGIVKAKVETINCGRSGDDIVCNLWEQRTVADETFAAAVGAHKAVVQVEVSCPFLDAGSGNVTYCHIHDPAALTPAQEGTVETCMDLLWADVSDGSPETIVMTKYSNTDRRVQYWYWTTDTDANWFADFLAGIGGPPVGVVE